MHVIKTSQFGANNQVNKYPDQSFFSFTHQSSSMPHITLGSHDHLSLFSAFATSLVLVTGYVAALYIRPSTRPSATTNRNDTAVIRERIKIITIYSIIGNFGIVPAVFLWSNVYDNYFNAAGTLRIFWGWRSGILEVIIDCVKGLLLTSILFIGPIVNYLYFDRQDELQFIRSINPSPRLHVKGYLTRGKLEFDLREKIATERGLRNFLFGPLTEEFIFRSGLIAIFLSSKVSERYVKSIFDPFFFSNVCQKLFIIWLPVVFWNRTCTPCLRTVRRI